MVKRHRFEMSPGLREALHALGLPRRKRAEADRPPPSTFPGRKTRPLPGQLSLLDETTPTERRNP
jgi:hypothetical protein